MPIYKRFRDILEERGIKQSHIVKVTGMNKDAVSNFLAGKRNLTAEEFLAWCQALDIEPNIFRKPA